MTGSTSNTGKEADEMVSYLICVNNNVKGCVKRLEDAIVLKQWFISECGILTISITNTWQFVENANSQALLLY
jgi:hypothetical protein